MVENSSYIEAGTEIIKDLKAENPGYLEIIEENGIVEKIIIKVGKVIPIDEKTLSQLNLNEIIEKGEEIYKGIKSESTVFIEKISEGLLIRPIVNTILIKINSR